MKPNEIIEKLNLERHIEGGCFKRVYESPDKIALPRFKGERATASSIYFLLEGQDFSAFHRLKSDEIWCLNYGSALTIYVLDDEGNLKKIILGDQNDLHFQVTIKANQWFAAEINDKSAFSLLSCIVTPSFEYQDFELADRKQLTALFPKHAELIQRLTR